MLRPKLLCLGVVALLAACSNLQTEPTNPSGQATNATPPSSPEQQVVAQLADQLEQQRLHRLRSTSLAQLLERRDGLIQAQTMYFI
mgnify:CR=1 FL=1